MSTACLNSALSSVRTITTGGNTMKRKLLAVLITAMFAAPAVYAQGTTAPKDSGDRPAASGSKGDAMKSDKGTAASAKGQATSDAKKDGSPDAMITSKIKTGF